MLYKLGKFSNDCGPKGDLVISKAEKLAINARKSISNYCYNECLAFCCRRGYLLLSQKEASLLQIGSEKLASAKFDKKFVFNLGKGCPLLKDYKCGIHKNPNRPKACREFPLFIHGKEIIVTEDCPAVKLNMLYPYLGKFKTMGYNLIYTSK